MDDNLTTAERAILNYNERETLALYEDTGDAGVVRAIESLARLRAENEVLRCIAWLMANFHTRTNTEPYIVPDDLHGERIWLFRSGGGSGNMVSLGYRRQPLTTLPPAILAEVLPAFRAWEQEKKV